MAEGKGVRHKIAFIRKTLDAYGGAERVLINLANSLSEIYDVYIINLYKNQPAYPISTNINGLYYVNEKKPWTKYFIFKDMIWLKRFLKEERIDVAISVGRGWPAIVSGACLGGAAKFIMWEHSGVYGLDLEANKGNKLSKILFEKHLVCGFDKTVLLTENEIPLYKKRYPKVSRIDAIYNSIDDRLFADIPDYDVKACKLMTVGRIAFQKGYEYLVDVAQKVLARHPDWRWDIYGDGEAEYKEKIAALIRERGLEGRLTLCGNRSDIYDLYQNYGIYVMTSRYEGLPMVLLEAKVKKLPLVSFDIDSGPSDIIEDGVSGYLVPPFDTDAMAERICELIEHPELRQKFSDHAWDNIDKFRKEAVVQKWVELIDGLAGDAKAGS